MLESIIKQELFGRCYLSTACMVYTMSKLPPLWVFLVFIPLLSHGGEYAHRAAGNNHSGIVDLSPELRDLLSREMRQLQKGMTEILPLYVSGEWAEIVPVASKMKNSYVLKQSLSDEQMHELHTKLPGGFIQLDKQFHYLSGMLEHAAETGKPELIGFYFSKMTEACVSCHTQYATHRFPALSPGTKGHEHH